MRSVHDVAGKPLEWVRVGARKHRQFELRARGDLVATLEFRGRLSHDADARTADGSWSFERRGIVRPPVVIEAGDDEVGRLLPARLTGPQGIRLAAHGDYRWSGEGAFPRWNVVRDDPGSLLLRARSTGVPAAGRGLMEIEPAGFGRPVLPLLCMCAWYLLVRDQGRNTA